MSVLYIVVPLALVIVAAAIGAFVWATRTGQFDDLSTPGVRVLFDDEPTRKPADQPDNDGNQ
ncbi:MAG: cbb3-type cytochrome oxidase assembly protein CcoS [Phycisphaeraceae bacterium]|nr:cbb3-type cytochrome oxidase assembly protein CcoS [Phycisphaeraceae bacterium]